MERAYRRRLDVARGVLLGVAFVLLTFVHFDLSPFRILLITVAVACAMFGGWGERALFPLAWRTFDASRPSPALEEEARSLAQKMGLRLDALRLVPDRKSALRIRWSGATIVVTTALRDLPLAERRFALARALAGVPNRATRFRRAAVWPTFYAGFAAWAFGVPLLSEACATALLLWGIAAWVCLGQHAREATPRALAATNDVEGARAFLDRERVAGSSRAARELAALETLGPTLVRETPIIPL